MASKRFSRNKNFYTILKTLKNTKIIWTCGAKRATSPLKTTIKYSNLLNWLNIPKQIIISINLCCILLHRYVAKHCSFFVHADSLNVFYIFFSIDLKFSPPKNTPCTINKNSIPNVLFNRENLYYQNQIEINLFASKMRFNYAFAISLFLGTKNR